VCQENAFAHFELLIIMPCNMLAKGLALLALFAGLAGNFFVNYKPFFSKSSRSF